MSISLKNISKVYNDGESELKALNNVTIDIDENEYVGIIGASGSGKSTLLNIIGMIDNPTTGEYEFNGINTKKISNELGGLRNKYFGYVFQRFGLIEYMSVYKNIKIPLEYRNIAKREIKEKVDDILKAFNLVDKRNMLPSQLSGGQCQKVAIARAIINDPLIILADEPTGALDKKSKDIVIEILNQLHLNGKTVILVTHDLKLIENCTRVIEIENGVIMNDYKK